VPESPSAAAAAGRASRPVFETPPVARPRRPRMLLVGVPVFAVFAAFAAIVWLAYQHGADGPAIGEPPLIKAPTTALKLPPDQAAEPEVADQGQVRDLLTDTPPSDRLERLLPSPEEPLTPDVAGRTPGPDKAAGGAPGTPSPAPKETAALDQLPPAPATPPAAQVTPPARPASPPPQAASPPPAQGSSPPAQAAPPAAKTAPAEAALPRAQGAAPAAPASSSPPPSASPAPAATPQIAAKPAGPQRPAPAAAERKTAEGTPPPASQPSPKEAEAALDVLLAEVTQSAKPGPAPANAAPSSASPPTSPPPAVASPPVAPPPVVASPAAPGASTAAANPAPRPSPQPAPANPAPVNPPGDRVAAVPPDRPQPPDAATRAAPTITPAPKGPVGGEGGYRIQLAAVRDQADARRAWDLFVVDLGPVLKGVKPFFERADTGNGVFYRIQVGPFASLQEAESLCDQLKQRNASCFVIRR
jgi:hypothetical protein